VIVNSAARYNFVGVTTAVDMDAPPILKWDKEDARNPLAWYVYHGGSTTYRWNLASGAVDVTGIMMKPALIGDDGHFATQYGNNVIFLLKDARDVGRPSLALFPECLRTELHSIRSTIESFSKAGTPDGADEGTANGLLVGSAKDCPVIRVTTAIGKADYRIDRWD